MATITKTEMSPTSLGGPVGLLCAPGHGEADMTHCMTREPATALRHPGWCDPARCERTDSDTAHESAPVVVHTRDATWVVSLVRADEHNFPGEHGRAPELSVRHDGPAGVFLDVGEAQALIGVLAEHITRAVTR